MIVFKLISNLFWFLSILIISGTYGIKIQLFAQRNITGLLWETNSTADCHNVPRDKWDYNQIQSIKTDTCFIAYNGSNCKSYRSMKYLPGDIYAPRDRFEDKVYIQSLHTCNDDEGGDQLNVDITRHSWFAPNKPEVLKSYKKVCSCVNVPQYVQTMNRWSIDNHHNDMLAYYEPDCSEIKGKPTFIAAGANFHSFSMNGHQSFEPDPNSTYFRSSCYSSKESTTESVTVELNEGFGAHPDNFVEIQTQIDQIKQIQDDFQNNILKQHSDDFNRLTELIAQLGQQFWNFTVKIRSEIQALKL